MKKAGIAGFFIFRSGIYQGSSWYQTAEDGNFALWPFFTWRLWLETRRLNPNDYIVAQCSAAKAKAAKAVKSVA